MSRPNNPNETLNSLHRAIKDGNTHRVGNLFANGAQVENNAMRDGVRDYANDTLALAIKSKIPEMVEIVLIYDAQVATDAVNLRGDRDYTLDSLALAIATGNPQIVGLILNAPDIEIINIDDEEMITNDRYHQDSVSQAIRSNSPIIVENILDRGGLVTNRAHSIYGMPDYYHNSLFMAIESGNDEIVRMVIRNGGEIINDAENPDFNSLNVALRRSNPNPRIIETLLRVGAVISNNEVNLDGRTEETNNTPPTASERYAEPRRNNSPNNTQIEHNARRNHLFVADQVHHDDEIVDLMLTFGADPENLQGERLSELRERLIARKLELQIDAAREISDKATSWANSEIERKGLVISDAMENILLFSEDRSPLLSENQFRRAVHFGFNRQKGEDGKLLPIKKSEFRNFVLSSTDKDKDFDDIWEGVYEEEKEEEDKLKPSSSTKQSSTKNIGDEEKSPSR